VGVKRVGAEVLLPLPLVPSRRGRGDIRNGGRTNSETLRKSSFPFAGETNHNRSLTLDGESKTVPSPLTGEGQGGGEKG